MKNYNFKTAGTQSGAGARATHTTTVSGASPTTTLGAWHSHS